VLGAWAVGGLVLGLLGERYGPHVRRAGVQSDGLRRSAIPVSASRTIRSATSAE
jgi:hypothetical protein